MKSVSCSDCGKVLPSYDSLAHAILEDTWQTEGLRTCVRAYDNAPPEGTSMGHAKVPGRFLLSCRVCKERFCSECMLKNVSGETVCRDCEMGELCY